MEKDKNRGLSSFAVRRLSTKQNKLKIGMLPFLMSALYGLVFYPGVLLKSEGELV